MHHLIHHPYFALIRLLKGKKFFPQMTCFLNSIPWTCLFFFLYDFCLTAFSVFDAADDKLGSTDIAVALDPVVFFF